jgi:hypothetical protein
MNDSPWFVHVWVYGHYSGGYEFETREEANRDAKDRRENLARGIKGLRYIVSQRLPSEIEKGLENT